MNERCRMRNWYLMNNLILDFALYCAATPHHHLYHTPPLRLPTNLRHIIDHAFPFVSYHYSFTHHTIIYQVSPHCIETTVNNFLSVATLYLMHHRTISPILFSLRQHTLRYNIAVIPITRHHTGACSTHSIMMRRHNGCGSSEGERAGYKGHLPLYWQDVMGLMTLRHDILHDRITHDWTAYSPKRIRQATFFS